MNTEVLQKTTAVEPNRIEIVTARPEDAVRWDAFVNAHTRAGNYHRWAWKGVIERSFHWPTYYLMAVEGERVLGVLPLVWQKSVLFGNFVTSIPFLNRGGVAGEIPEIEEALVREAVGITERCGANHLELRHRGEEKTFAGLITKTNKVTVVREVTTDEEALLRGIAHKARSDVRKSLKSGMTAEFGGEEFLDDFYEIFAENMRELGTPVYARSFFAEMLRALPNENFICRVSYEGKAVASSFLCAYRDTVEAGWSSSRAAARALKPNMFLYWSIQLHIAQQGYKVFDFGRSTVGAGTHRFKMQWGSEEIPLFWHYWLRDGKDLPELNPENPKYKLAIRAWQRMPLGLTKAIGPRIVRCLP